MTTTTADAPLSPDDPAARAAAANILRRHNANAAEANITSAIRDFLIATRLATKDEMDEENPPAEQSHSAVDLTVRDTFIESKRRIGMGRGFSPHPEYVRQLDDYLAQSEQKGRVRNGILTDGKHWLLRRPGMGEVKTTAPYGVVLESADKWHRLYEWLRDWAIETAQEFSSTRKEIVKHFGVSSLGYQEDIETLRALYEQAKENPSIVIKRRLWQVLLRTALGEIAQGEAAMDDLFIRHTYLTTVIGIVVQASFRIDVRELAETRPDDLVLGQKFRSDTGLEGVIESDFFAWPTEVGADDFLRQLALRIARFDWRDPPTDVAAILYETVIPPSERKQLGEYYTPHWLAGAMVREIVTDPLNQRVLDPACGSGTFLAEAITHFIETADNNPDPLDTYTPLQLLNQLRERVIGIDVHPVAVHLARAAWVLAAKPLFDRARRKSERPSSNFSAPVYLGDSLQLRFRTGDMFAEHNVSIQVRDAANTELVFPISLVDRAENFDRLISDVATAIESDEDPLFALNDAGISGDERNVLTETIKKLQRLHSEGRDHIWAYYTRNMVRPVVLARQKVDVIVGNPPWLIYRNTISDLRDGLRQLGNNLYGIWQGGRHAPNQEVASLFYTRCVDLYLNSGGVIGMVMPHSALQTGQHSRWRSGRWRALRDEAVLSVDFTGKVAWDLERLQPNDFFPVPACVVFATRVGVESPPKSLAGSAERWNGQAGSDDIVRVKYSITDTSATGDSPYARHSRKGADIYPRVLNFVEEIDNSAVIRAGGTIMVKPRRGSQDKAPWNALDLTEITGQTVEAIHIHNIHHGETLVPFATLDPLKAVLPFRHGDGMIAKDASADGGINPSGMENRMRERWRIVDRLWNANKGTENGLSQIENLDHWNKLTSQLTWQHDSGGMPVRLVYSASGAPTAARVNEADALIDFTLFWIGVTQANEANFLLSIINSETMYEALAPLMPKGQFGARHVQKHLWKLPIPRYDEGIPLHRDLAAVGEAAAAGVQVELAKLREERGDKLTVTIARREIRKWLRESEEGGAVERLVGELLRKKK